MNNVLVLSGGADPFQGITINATPGTSQEELKSPPLVLLLVLLAPKWAFRIRFKHIQPSGLSITRCKVMAPSWQTLPHLPFNLPL